MWRPSGVTHARRRRGRCRGAGGRARLGADAVALARRPRELARALPGRAVALPAGGLQEPRGGEAEREAAEGDGPRLATREILDVAQDGVGIGLREVAAEALGALRGLVG